MKARSAPFVVSWIACGLLASCAPSVHAAQSTENAQWIWSPAQTAGEVPSGRCYFRKTFTVKSPDAAEIEITCDDAYELYVNGRHIGSGQDRTLLNKYDISKFVRRGRNTIAVQATNNQGSTAALVARVLIKERGGTYVSHSSDASWKTALEPGHRWTTVAASDRKWDAARPLGALGDVVPWDVGGQVAKGEGRFRVMTEFNVQWVVPAEKTGSLIAFTFDEQGDMIASREGGPLLRLSDTTGDGTHDTVTTYCDQLTNCQGLLALNGKLFAVGDGPQGAALYRVSDEDRDGTADKVEALIRFRPEKMGEHGPHGLVLGPDGLIYVLVGNLARVQTEAEPTSPYLHSYEGDLNQPRIEDPTGHAVGGKAPGGTIVRTDVDGSFVETFCGGLRNPYDLAFNRLGELFTYDADMESDVGLPWYRPTRVNHLPPGAELGWRSGWSKWPEYFLDSLPGTLNVGYGSPTGIVFYDHYKYPMRFQGAMFAGDWAQGRIDVIRMLPDGGSYRARRDVFLEGKPLNVTDLEVGPDGWLYFSTGGRGTEGGIYRVVWTGRVPAEARETGEGIDRAIRQPQIASAWGRQEIARVQHDLDEKWEPQLAAIATSGTRTVRERLRALDLMQLFGPFPEAALLLSVAEDPDPRLRAKGAALMGIHAHPATHERLLDLLEDSDATVRRVACESLVRADQAAPIEKLVDLLADKDRHVAFAARLALTRRPLEQWQNAVLQTPRTRAFLQGAAGIVLLETPPDVARQIVDRCLALMQGDVLDADVPAGFISDRNFTDLLRVLQLALIRSELKGDDLVELRKHLAREYPSRDTVINRELVRLLAYVGNKSVSHAMLAQLKGNLPPVEKLHLLAHMPFMEAGFTTQEKLELIEHYEAAHGFNKRQSYGRYVNRMTRRLAASLGDEERRLVLNRASRWPHAALAVLANLPPDPGDTLLRHLEKTDLALDGVEGDAVKNLRTGIVAVLGRSRKPGAMAYLRQVYQRDPERRVAATLGLAQSPDAENWPLLVRSLPILDGPLAVEVLGKLSQADLVPKHPEPIRQAILCGLRLQEDGATEALALLEHWTEKNIHAQEDDWETALAKWQAWFHKEHPDQPEAKLPVDSVTSKWTYGDLLGHLGNATGDARKGALAFERAQCAKCHRYGERGEPLGPDLTTISSRFQRKEILQAILYPSHVISDQYASKKLITTDGRTLSGIVAPTGQEKLTVLLSDGRKVTLQKSQVDEMQPSRKSVMPEGLLNTLTLEEVADLFAYFDEPPRTRVTSRRDEPPR